MWKKYLTRLCFAASDAKVLVGMVIHVEGHTGGGESDAKFDE